MPIANVGSKWVDGKLVFFSKITGNEIVAFDPTSSAILLGGAAFGPAAAQADSTATDVAGLLADHNALLAKLRAAGLLDT
jgi:archaellum component FlaG (FlaF/FlaG flagellin family)